VIGCLRKSKLLAITASSSSLWEGWDPKVGGFVYVQMYPTLKSARAQAKHLADEESGLAKRLVISQHIAPYHGSPVPLVVKCLGGKMISKPPPSQNGTFNF
jgi:hypothetical protein